MTRPTRFHTEQRAGRRLSDLGKVNVRTKKPGYMIPLPAVKENEPFVVILNYPCSSSSISLSLSLYNHNIPWYYWPCGWNLINLTRSVLEWSFGKSTTVQLSSRWGRCCMLTWDFLKVETELTIFFTTPVIRIFVIQPLRLIGYILEVNEVRFT